MLGQIFILLRLILHLVALLIELMNLIVGLVHLFHKSPKLYIYLFIFVKVSVRHQYLYLAIKEPKEFVALIPILNHELVLIHLSVSERSEQLSYCSVTQVPVLEVGQHFAKWHKALNHGIAPRLRW